MEEIRISLVGQAQRDTEALVSLDKEALSSYR